MLNTTISSLILTGIYSSPFFSGDKTSFKLKRSAFSYFTNSIFSEITQINVKETEFSHILNSVIKMNSKYYSYDTLSYGDRLENIDETVTITRCYFHDVSVSGPGACVSFADTDTRSYISISTSYFYNIYTSSVGGILYTPAKVRNIYARTTCYESCSAGVAGSIFYSVGVDKKAHFNYSTIVYSGNPSVECQYTFRVTNAYQNLLYYTNFSAIRTAPNSISTNAGAYVSGTYRFWVYRTYFINCSNGMLLHLDLTYDPSKIDFSYIIAAQNTATQAPLLLPTKGIYFMDHLFFKNNDGVVFSKNPYGNVGIYVSKSYFDFPEPDKDDAVRFWVLFNKCEFQSDKKIPNYHIVNSGACVSVALSRSLKTIIIIFSVIGGVFALFIIITITFIVCC